MRINLLEEKEAHKINWFEIGVTIAIILIFAVPVLHYFVNYIQLQNLESERNQWRQQVSNLQPQEDYYLELEEEIDDFYMPERIEPAQYPVASALEEFGIITPDNLTFESIDYIEGELYITGYTNEVDSIIRLASNINTTDIFSLLSIEQFEGNSLINFNFDLNLKPEGD